MKTPPSLFRTALAALVFTAAPARADQDLGPIPLAAGSAPFNVAVNPVTNKIYVASSNAATVTVLDGATQALPKIVNLAGIPKGLAVNPLTNTIYITIPGAGRVAVLDGATDTVRASVAVNGLSPERVAVDPVTNRIYVVNTGSNNVAVLDGDTDALVLGTPNLIAVGTSPAALAVNPVTHKVYVANMVSNNVTVIDGTTGAARTPFIAVGASPAGVAVDATKNLIYVANSQGSSVSVLDGETDTPATPLPIPVAANPTDVVVNPATNNAFVVSVGGAGGAKVAVFDGTSLLRTLDVAPNPIAVAVNPVTNKAYVASSTSNFVTVIENDRTPVQLDVGGQQQGVAVNPITNRIYATVVAADAVRVIDGAVNRTQTFEVGDGPAALAVNPVNQKVYVANIGAKNLSVIDPAKSTPDHFQAGEQPVAVAVNPITERAYFANVGPVSGGTVAGTVTIFSGGNGNPTLLTVPVGLRPRAIAVNPVTERVYVANSATDPGVGPFDAGTVTVFNGAANNLSETGSIPVLVGMNPTALAIDPATNRIYVANNESNDVTVIDGATSTVLVPSIPVGPGPGALAVNPATGKVYVAGANVTVMNASHQPTTVPTTAGIAAQDVAVNPQTNRIYVPTFSSNVSQVLVIDGATDTIVATVPIAANPTGPSVVLKVAVNVATNQIYVSDARNTNVLVIDGITLRTTTVPLPAGANPSAIAVDPITDRVFVSNFGTDNVTMITPVPAGQSSLATSIARLDRTATTGPEDFSLTAVSGYAPSKPAIQQIYYQLDATTGPWQAATPDGPSATARFTGLPLGLHILYAFAVDPQVATCTNAGLGGSPIPGQVNEYLFRVIETPSIIGTFTFAVTRVIAREEEPVVTLTVRRDRAEPASVEYRTVKGTALAGSDFTAGTGTLFFGAEEREKVVAVQVRNDDVGENVETFSVELRHPSFGSRVGVPGTAFVVLLDDDTPDNALSRPDLAAPDAPPAADASITVNLVTFNPSTGNFDPLAARWRLFGELDWRASGSNAPGLTAGNYGIEFQPLAGFVTPLLQTLPVEAGQRPTLQVTYAALTAGATVKTGSLRVTLAPAAGRWRVTGEPGFRPSADAVPTPADVALPIGPYTIEFEFIAGRETPPRRVVEIEEDVLTALTSTYLIADTAFGATTPDLPTPVADARTKNPFRFLGQIQTDNGFGTGFVPLERVVVTCAHVLFDDGALAYTEGVRWFFQFEKGAFVTPPLLPRGNYTFSGYAAQRTVDQSPGISTPASQQLDAAALYFLEPAARGGASGYLASDSSANSWLLDNARKKLLAGYPVEGPGLDPDDLGRLHASLEVAATDFALASGRVFKTKKLRSFPGNSGGPLCVQFDDDEFYPAAIYLGGRGETLVRAINSQVIDLIERARVSGDGGDNNSSGGIIQVNIPLDGTVRFAFGRVKVFLGPDGARAGGARWHLEGDPDERVLRRASGETTTGLSPSPPGYTVIYEPVENYTAPAARIVPVQAGREANVLADTPERRYRPIFAPKLISLLAATADLGLPFKYQIAATFDPVSYSATGLPAGLKLLDPAKGLISGTPARTLTPGDYPVELSVRNESGKPPTKATLILKLQPPGMLTVALDPATGGAVPKSFLNSLRRVGSIVTITARPAPGFLFESWRDTGDLQGAPLALTATYRFVMKSEVKLTARFARNIFPAAQGAYSILLPGETLDAAGRVQLTVNALGAFTGTLHLGGVSTALRGSLRPTFNGTAVLGLYAADLKLGERSVNLTLRLTETGTLTATLADNGSGAFNATASAVRGAFSAKTPATNFTGAYTALLPISRRASLPPAGHGYGTLTVSRLGVVKFTGFLGDGSPVTATAVLAANGAWPFFAAPKGKGVVVGTLTATGTPPSRFTGELLWPRTADPADTARIAFDAARYQAPPVDYPQAIVTFDAALASSAARTITIAGNLGTAPAPGAFTVRFSPATGLFSGTLRNPTRPFSGAVLQRNDTGQGFIKTPPGTIGTVQLQGGPP